jgi:hypothetical protein
MEDAEARRLAIEVVEQLEGERSDVIGSYVVYNLLSRELSKYVTRSPIGSGDPITISVIREIRRVHPDLSVIDSTVVRFALVAYLDEIKWAEQRMELQEAFPRSG